MLKYVINGDNQSYEASGMPTWDEWRNLTDEQRQYASFKLMVELDARTRVIGRMVKLYSCIGGVAGGIVTTLSILAIFTKATSIPL